MAGGEDTAPAARPAPARGPRRCASRCGGTGRPGPLPDLREGRPESPSPRRGPGGSRPDLTGHGRRRPETAEYGRTWPETADADRTRPRTSGPRWPAFRGSPARARQRRGGRTPSRPRASGGPGPSGACRPRGTRPAPPRSHEHRPTARTSCRASLAPSGGNHPVTLSPLRDGASALRAGYAFAFAVRDPGVSTGPDASADR
ncbi:hypothetical protein EBF04_25155 [Streptomyces sp. I6]|nr:hypothetical protein EBF04_25155 [Streptomyces sp. I6]